nr:hypothetical protein [Roseovarius salinarum]
MDLHGKTVPGNLVGTNSDLGDQIAKQFICEHHLLRRAQERIQPPEKSFIDSFEVARIQRCRAQCFGITSRDRSFQTPRFFLFRPEPTQKRVTSCIALEKVEQAFDSLLHLRQVGFQRLILLASFSLLVLPKTLHLGRKMRRQLRRQQALAKSRHHALLQPEARNRLRIGACGCPTRLAAITTVPFLANDGITRTAAIAGDQARE